MKEISWPVVTARCQSLDEWMKVYTWRQKPAVGDFIFSRISWSSYINIIEPNLFEEYFMEWIVDIISCCMSYKRVYLLETLKASGEGNG